MTLDEFVNKVKSDIVAFDEAYKTQNALSPDTHPLELPEVNEGLWIEFFLVYMQTGEA